MEPASKPRGGGLAGGATARENRAMARYARFGDRSSYKSSEVVGLFVLSIFGGGLFFLICMAIDHLVRRFTG